MLPLLAGLLGYAIGSSLNKNKNDAGLKKPKNDIVKFRYYTLSEHTPEHSEQIEGLFLTKKEAKEEIEIHDTFFENTDSEIIITTWQAEASLSEYLDEMGYDEDDFDSKKEIVSELKEQFITGVFEDVDTEHLEDDVLETIDDINKSTDNLLLEVQEKLNDKFGKTLHDNINFSKYTKLYLDEDNNLTFDIDNGLDIDDKNYKKHKEVSIRIADHTHNPRNGKNDLNVLIANKDATKKRFFTANTQLSYTSEDDADDIVDDILNYWK